MDNERIREAEREPSDIKRDRVITASHVLESHGVGDNLSLLLSSSASALNVMLFFYLLLGHLINGIAANTEIINFSATTGEFSDLSFTDSWSVQISHSNHSKKS